MKLTGTVDFKNLGMDNDSIYTLYEKDFMEIDTQVDDTGQVSRSTYNIEYEIKQTARGEILSATILNEERATTEYVYQYYRQGAIIFPAEAISIGHSWTQTYRVETENNDTVEVSTTFKLKGEGSRENRDCLIIEYQGEGYIPVRNIPNDTMNTIGHDQYKSNGILYFDPIPGVMVSFEEKRHIDYLRLITLEGRQVKSTSEAKDFIRSVILSDSLSY